MIKPLSPSIKYLLWLLVVIAALILLGGLYHRARQTPAGLAGQIPPEGSSRLASPAAVATPQRKPGLGHDPSPTGPLTSGTPVSSPGSPANQIDGSTLPGVDWGSGAGLPPPMEPGQVYDLEIGRASCRERV